jgi:hypothetical protein
MRGDFSTVRKRPPARDGREYSMWVVGCQSFVWFCEWAPGTLWVMGTRPLALPVSRACEGALLLALLVRSCERAPPLALPAGRACGPPDPLHISVSLFRSSLSCSFNFKRHEQFAFNLHPASFAGRVRGKPAGFPWSGERGRSAPQRALGERGRMRPAKSVRSTASMLVCGERTPML